MGGIGIGTRNNYTINIKNPASYSEFDSISFVFEGAVNGHYVTLKTSDISESYTSATMSHLLFGFPVARWWRSSFGLLPYSETGYNVNDHIHFNNIGNTQYIFEGEGGISQVFWGNSFRPFKSLSLGVNAAYLFGTMDRSQKVTFPDSANLISTIVNNAISVKDIYLEFGTQYHSRLKDIDLVIGATYNPETKLNATRNRMVRTYFGEQFGVPLILDTISIIDNEEGTLTIPEGYGLGFSLGKKERWLIGAEYKFEGWENYKAFGASDSLTNSQTFRFGGNITPNPNSLSYYQRINYRFGAHINQSYLNLRDQQINGFGITFGVGLPVVSNAIRRTRSMVNLGIEAGRRGTITNGLIQENYFNFYVSVSIYEMWFLKRRYQ